MFSADQLSSRVQNLKLYMMWQNFYHITKLSFYLYLHTHDQYQGLLV